VITFKKRTGHQDTECVEREKEWELGREHPLPSRLGGLRSVIATPLGSEALEIRALAENLNDFGAFCTRKQLLVNRNFY